MCMQRFFFLSLVDHIGIQVYQQQKRRESGIINLSGRAFSSANITLLWPPLYFRAVFGDLKLSAGIMMIDAGKCVKGCDS